MTDFLQDLNDIQREAVVNFQGPSMVIAGAGSGKTRVLTYRIAYLLDQGAKPSSVLALTFTNKAAKEMRERIATLVGQKIARSLWMGTFHSVFSRILRIEGHALGYEPTFTIYDSADSKSLIKTLLKELDLNPEQYKPGEVYNRISSAKNNLITPQAYASNSGILSKDASSGKPRIVDVYKHYAQRCKKAGAMDFDDLLLNTNILFRDFPEILSKYQNMFKYLLVDEYQDTNYAQYLIVKKLCEKHNCLCVVGDDAQSIYSFRGAKIENILNFKIDYPDYKFFKLEQNYRSTQNIVNASNSIIARNSGQIQKNVWSANEHGEKIKVIKSTTDGEEGFLITNDITDALYRDRLNYSDFAILYRTNAQSRIFEDALRKKNIPYKLYGSLSFYQRKEIKDLVSYFRLVTNPKDEEALKRIINYPARGIGDTTLAKIANAASITDKSMWAIISAPQQYSLEINKGTQTKLVAFIQLINEFTAKVNAENAYDAAHYIALKSGLLADLRSGNTPENISKLENIEELLNSIKEYVDNAEEDKTPTLSGYLENIALLTNADNEKEEDHNRVTLMTIHSSKGLEFAYVYISGMEEELFPSRMSSSTLQELEEERRLFYVAVTRAKKQCTLSYSQMRYKWGTSTPCNPSRFIKEIAPEFIEMPNEDMPVNLKIPGRQPSLSWKTQPSTAPSNKWQPLAKIAQPGLQPQASTFKADDSELIEIGMEVEHERFGKGKITTIEGPTGDKKATVSFEASGDKKLLLKFAKLKILKA